ncbi:MAG: ATP-binding protein [Fimbriimonadaceae bacterium]|nr:ATP-binding protein [Fimbriimonadaceae bacterium]
MHGDLGTLRLRVGNGAAVLAGLELTGMLGVDLYRRIHRLDYLTPIATVLNEAWCALPQALATMLGEWELLLALTGGGGEPARYALFAVMREGDTLDAEGAGRHARTRRDELSRLLRHTWDFCEFAPAGDDGAAAVARALDLPGGYAVERRVVTIDVRETVVPAISSALRRTMERLRAIRPWTPDRAHSWWPVLDLMASSAAFCAVLVSARHSPPQPEAATAEAQQALADAEDVFVKTGEDFGWLRAQAARVRDAATRTYDQLHGPLLAVRVRVVGEGDPPHALHGMLAGAIDASIEPGQARGGIALRAETGSILEQEDPPPLHHLFAPEEAVAVLRSPHPILEDREGIRSVRSRTYPAFGASGDDAAIGVSSHRGRSRVVRVGKDMRFRHAYVVGQTGTGKSTLLLNMIAHDVREGRGVTVIDPHGPLFYGTLERIPECRMHEVVVLDLSDSRRPVGFNPLLIDEDDPRRYRYRRDARVDEFMESFDQMYDLRLTGGPIFERHMRAMLALLMGSCRPGPDWPCPKLSDFPRLYSEPDILRSFMNRLDEDADAVLLDFVKEAERSRGEGSIHNVAPYVTSKLGRFFTDTMARMVLCQPRTLDFADILRSKRILLVHLGKGHVGNIVAALVASQVVNRLREAALRRGADDGAVPHHLYVDEFQMIASPRFSELLAEARKYRLALTVAHQYLDQIPPTVLSGLAGNVGTMISLRVGTRDAEWLANLFAPVFSAPDLVSLANFQAIVASPGAFGAPFSVAGLGMPTTFGEEHGAEVHALARETWGTPVQQVEGELADRSIPT